MSRKRWILAIMAFVLLASVASPAWAQAAAPDEAHSWADAGEELLKYRSEWKKLNELEQEHLKLKIEALQKQIEASDLYADQHKSKKGDNMKAALKYKQKMRSIHTKMKENKKKMLEQRRAAAEAIQNGKEKEARKALDAWIDLKKEHNKLYRKKLDVWDKMLTEVK